MRVVTWNLYHGRAKQPAGRDLRAEFAAALAAWDWDFALLQEVPPWWPPHLPGADHATALTSRNALLPLRKAIATRWPDLIKSNGGGANAILVRRNRIEAHARLRLRCWPERRVVHAVKTSGLWVANLHAQVHSDERAHADREKAAAAVRRWAGDAPAILGGDFNVRTPRADGFVHAGGRGVDHVLVRGLEPVGVEVPTRGPLSDHAPVIVTVASRGRIMRPDASR